MRRGVSFTEAAAGSMTTEQSIKGLHSSVGMIGEAVKALDFRLFPRFVCRRRSFSFVSKTASLRIVRWVEEDF